MNTTHYISNIKIILSLIFLIITTRLAYLQLYAHQTYADKSSKNYTQYEKIPALRGSIRDCNGKLLATNRAVTDLYWSGTGNTTLHTQQDETLFLLQSILHKNFSYAEYQKITRAEHAKKKYLIARDINAEQLCILSEHAIYHPNILCSTDAQRFYPQGAFCTHITGYIDRKNRDGKMGLEKIYNHMLTGKPGTIKKTVNSQRILLEQDKIETPCTGQDIITTIDSDIQLIANQLFENSYTGACIVIDPKNGAVKAIISQPNFDPEIFLHTISHQTWQSLQINNPFINRACNATYPPGSLFKLITITAALEEDIIKPHTTWLCPGYAICGNRKYWCNRRWGHGALSTAQAIAQSCNILFYEIGKKIDIDTLARYAFSFGLGQATNITFTEQTGLIPTRDWKRSQKGQPWWQGETLSVAIGQSFLLVTPIQIARMIGSIFTGYLITPRILKSEPIQTYSLTISPETRMFLQESMRSVITKGTGKRISNIEDMTIFAKTSTAQVSTLKKSASNPEYSEHGWFVAHFQYKDHDPLVIVLLVEHAGSSRIPTIMAKNFFVEYKKLLYK